MSLPSIVARPVQQAAELGPEHEDHGDGGAELGAGEGQEVLHVGAAVGQDQHTRERGGYCQLHYNCVASRGGISLLQSFK